MHKKIYQIRLDPEAILEEYEMLEENISMPLTHLGHSFKIHKQGDPTQGEPVIWKVEVTTNDAHQQKLVSKKLDEICIDLGVEFLGEEQTKLKVIKR